MRGFVVLPRRWVVEHTFSWFGRNRRLAKDFENLTETVSTFVTIASIQLPSGGLLECKALTPTTLVGLMAPVRIPAASGRFGIGQPIFPGASGAAV